MTDPALDTLLLPFASGLLDWPDRALFLRARHGAGLADAPKSALLCQQSSKPHADALERSGFSTTAEAEGEYPLILALPPRQREEARAVLARAVMHAGTEGMVVAAAANNEGARTAEQDLARLAGPVQSLSKHKSRVFWTSPAAGRNLDLAREWEAADRPQPIGDARFQSRPGLFSWDRIDPGSKFLAEHLAKISGRVADLGAGFGYLSSEILARCPAVTALDLYEAEARALDLARVNLAGASVPLDFLWHDVTTGLPRRYDAIVTNPPFHDGRADRTDLGQGFIKAAAGALVPGGRLLLVANRHLPYEATLAASLKAVKLVAEEDRYKILEAVKSRL